MSFADLVTVMPEVVVTATACLVLLADAVLDRKAARRRSRIASATSTIIATAVTTISGETAARSAPVT